MTAALVEFAYVAAVAWTVPFLLRRLTASGISARLGLASWLTGMASVLIGVLAALEFLVGAAVTGLPWLADAVCRTVTGQVCAPTLYRSAAFELTLGAIAVAAAATATATAWRYARKVRHARRRTRVHAEAARIAGRRLPGAHPVVVLDDAQLAAYCMPGRPATIVLTTGALAVLDPEQLAAVLAHERAHLAGRHHLVSMLTRALGAIFPLVPIFAQGAGEVARLAEMCADDAAARHSGRRTLLAALLTMGTGQAVPVSALAATTGAVAARARRLIEPPPRSSLAATRTALVSVTLVLILATSLVTVFAARG